MFWIICFVGLIAQSFAQIAEPHGCPIITPQAQLDATRVLGRWYEWARIDDTYELGHECVHVSFFNDAQGNLWEQSNATIRISGANYLWRATIEAPENAPNGLFNIVFNQLSTHKMLRAGLIQVNWDQYIILVACSDVIGVDEQFAWVFTRNPTLAPQYEREVTRALQRNNLSLDRFTMVNHENCPAY